MNVMLLAAGEGTRLRPYTTILPKPAIPFLTIPLAGHALHFLDQIEINKLIVNTYHLPTKIHELFHSLPKVSNELHFSDEVGEILGSGGGLSKARSHFIQGGDFVLMNADEVILPQDTKIFPKAVASHQAKKAIATLMVMDHPGVGTHFGGVWVDANNKVLGFGKTPIAGSVKAWHFVGVQILSDKVFEFLPEQGVSNILYDALAAAISVGELVQAFPFECHWFETGNPTDFLKATSECISILGAPEESPAKTHLLECFKRFSPEGVSVEKNKDSTIIKSSSARIDAAATINGFACIGPEAELSPQAKIKNVIVGSKVLVNESATETLLI